MSRNLAPAVASARNRSAALQRHRGQHDPAVAEAKRDLKVELLAQHIDQVVADWPPITPSQRDRLALLLRGGAV